MVAVFFSNSQIYSQNKLDFSPGVKQLNFGAFSIFSAAQRNFLVFVSRKYNFATGFRWISTGKSNPNHNFQIYPQFFGSTLNYPQIWG